MFDAITWLLLFGSPLLCAWLALRPLWRWPGSGRWFGLIGLVPMLLVVVRFIVDTRRDPTSHNLFPFEVFLASVAGLIALTVVYIATGRSRAKRERGA